MRLRVGVAALVVGLATPALRLGSGQALRLGSGQALRLGSGQALRLGSGQALRLGSGQALRLGSGQALATEAAAPWKKKLGEAGKAVRLGLVAMPREPLPSTIGNLERFAGLFHREHVTAVIALGGLGSTEEEIGRTLGALKAAQVPVLALPGGRETESAFHAGVKKAQKAGLDVVDLVEHRALAGDGVGIESLPGGAWPYYLSDGALRAQASELNALDASITDEKRPALLVASTPPRAGGTQGIGWAPGGADDGSAELGQALPSLGAKVGAFAASAGADSRAFDGRARVDEGQWAERLYVAVGAADAMAPHHGQAVLLELADGKARAKVIR